MKFLVVGLGSMGKRRVRCLQALNQKQICGFDPRADRVEESVQKYGIKAFTQFEQAVEECKPDALIISVPPLYHHIYIKYALENKLHCFIEASVVDDNMLELIRMEKNTAVTIAPSSTLYFHPAIKMIGEIVKSGELGKISNITYHSGQYLPDWHTYEKVSDFYVSNPLTGGGREIVPFEITWFVDLFGFPKKVCGHVRKTIHIEGAEKIDDTYNFLMDYEGFLVTMTIDVVSRFAVRKLLINGDQKQLTWDWNIPEINIYDPDKKSWEKRAYKMLGSAQGYNANIGENMYIDEVAAFLKSIEEKKSFVNTLERDYAVLQLLYAIEESDKQSKYMEIKGV